VITWRVNGMGGRVYAGIPSEDVAIAMAVDLEQYGIDEDRQLVQVAVTVDRTESDYGKPYVLVCGGDSRGLGVHPEERCDLCRRTADGERSW
jgi:hypothetical protein